MSDNAATIWMMIVVLIGMPIGIGIAAALVMWVDNHRD